MTGRYSSPPCERKLRDSTKTLTASLDVLAERVKGQALPVAIATAASEITDHHRAAVLRELRQRLAFSPDGLRAYEAEVKARLGR